MFGNKFYLSNYQSNFAHLQMKGNHDKNVNLKSSRPTSAINNPLIVPLGISIYDRDVFESLQCVPIDYKNVEYAFNIVRGFDMAFYNPENQIVLKRHQIGKSSKNKNQNVDINGNIKVSSKKKFKLKWNEKEIFQFNDEIYNLLNDARYNYDCLLYFISCHGDRGGIIYDSNGNKIPLITIFDKFSNQNCSKLRNKPKIYFIEACRGNQRTKRIANSNFVMTNEDKIQTLQQIGNSNNVINISLTQSSTSKAKTPEPSTPADEKTMEIDYSLTNIDKIQFGTTDAASNDNKSTKFDNKFSKYNYNREIYANTDGYAVVEPGSKGAYMIRSITQSIVNNQVFKKSFDEIMIHSRKVMLKLMGMSIECGAQVIDDHNNIPKNIIFN